MQTPTVSTPPKTSVMAADTAGALADLGGMPEAGLPFAALLPGIAATGKDLPVAGKAESDASAAEKDLTSTDGSTVLTAFPLAASLVLVGPPQSDLLRITLDQARARGGAKVATVMDAAKRHQPAASPTGLQNAAVNEHGAETASAPSAARGDAASSPAVGALPLQLSGQVAISIAAPPVAAPGPENPAADGEQPGSVQSATSQLAARGDLACASRGDASRQDSQDRTGTRHDTGSDASLATARRSNVEFSAAAYPAPLAMSDRATPASTATAASVPAPAAAMPDRAEAVANVVNRLIAAREAGLGALTSVVIAHREFGDLTVNFADNGNALDISVTAADADRQRALAAALHTAERPVARDTQSPAPPSSQHGTASHQQDRGTEGAFARDSSGRQPRGEAMRDERRSGQAATSIADDEAAVPAAGGIYV